MTKDEALRMALKKAFDLGKRYWSWADSEYSSHWKKADAAKQQFDQLIEDTIREALAQPEQEPVAWIRRHPNGALSNEILLHVQVERVRRESGAWVPLYTTPPHRKPLTDEEIDKLPWEPHEGNPMTFAEGLRYFARAIEAAHGIKE